MDHRPSTVDRVTTFFMPLADKVVSAKKIEGFLRATIVKGGFKLKYRITVDPPLPEERDWERPDILVELSTRRRGRQQRCS